MKNRKIFLGKSVSFAIEMVRASLCHAPTPLRLEGLWMQMNMATDLMGDKSHGQRFITLAILIYPSIRVSANCRVNCVEGEWESGDVEIWLLDSAGQRCDDAHWKFHCQLEEGRLNVQPAK
jgi:hypothetical protein